MNQYKLGKQTIVKRQTIVIKPVQRVMLFTNARDEKRIKEWAAHHLIIGFTYVYIFDHKSVVPLTQVFNGFDQRVIVERCEMDTPPKIPLMTKAAYIAKRCNMDWFIYLDADEFIYLYCKNVKTFLQKFPFADSVSLNWLMFGTNHYKTEPYDSLLMEAYTKSDGFFNNHVKTFVRPLAVKNVTNPHYYEVIQPGRMYSVDGTPMSTPYFSHKNIVSIPENSLAFLAHYIYQSEETYMQRKINRPTDDTGGMRELEKTLHSQYNNVNTHIMRDKYARLLRYFLFEKSKK
jgi:hypothetical protein